MFNHVQIHQNDRIIVPTNIAGDLTRFGFNLIGASPSRVRPVVEATVTLPGGRPLTLNDINDISNAFNEILRLNNRNAQ